MMVCCCLCVSSSPVCPLCLQSYRCLFAEVSALTGSGIVDAIAMMVRYALLSLSHRTVVVH